ncbi:MAG: hypothetical protein ACI9N0_000794 [Ilumatobacter sp.]|jgi:hypothetical protein
MATWTCPDCQRSFGAVGRGHMCAPGLTIEEFLAGAADFVAPVFDAVHRHLVAVDKAEGDARLSGGGAGDLIVDPLEGKVLFKNGPTFCILDVKTKWVAVGFSLRRSLDTGRMSRKTIDSGGRFYHVINVADAEIIDDEFKEWLTEAYHHRTAKNEALPDGHDPMVPDDIDFEIAPPR